MCSFPEASGPVRRESGGFTLIEVLISLTIGSLLVILIMAAVSQQGRMARLQASQEDVQQNARGAMELLVSELRALPREGLIHAGASRIVLHVPRAAGLLCTANVPAGGSIHMLVSGNAWSRTTADTLGVAVRFSSSDTTGIFEPAYATMDRVRVTTQTSVTSPCSTLNPNGDLRMLTLTPEPSNAGYSSAMRTATIRHDMYLYVVTEYAIGTTTVPGQWITRTSREGTQPLAGPLPASGTPGLRFRYFAGNEELIALPITDPEVLSTVTRINVEVTTVARTPAPGGAAAASRRLETDVYLRNNGGAS